MPFNLLYEFNILLEKLKRIKKRFIIVGSFKQTAVNGVPELYIFSNRSDIDDSYRGCFAGKRVYSIGFDNFVSAVGPALIEILLAASPECRHRRIKTVIPSANEKGENSIIIGSDNFFMMRAVFLSLQEAFRSEAKGVHHLDCEILRTSDKKTRGKEILKQVRRNLRCYCRFKSKEHKLTLAAMKLLHDCAGDMGLPAQFQNADRLPNGFARALCDFVFDHDTGHSFKRYLSEIDFEVGCWHPLEPEDAIGRTAFVNIVDALRDRLVFGKADQFNAHRLRGESLADRVGKVVDDDMVSQVQEARQAFNSKRQIFKSKMLLSMILEWVLTHFYELKSVKAQKTDKDKSKAIEREIFEETEDTASPVKRASEAERERFAHELTEGFEKLLSAVIAEEPSELIATLPDELKQIAETIREDVDTVNTLRTVSGMREGEETHNAFMKACKTILLDVMCAALYRSPCLTPGELYEEFWRQIKVGYLTAIMLSDANQEKVVKIVRDNLKQFEENVDSTSREIKKSGQIVASLLQPFLMDVLADTEIKTQLKEGLRILAENQALREEMYRSGMLRDGAGQNAVTQTSGPDAELLEATNTGAEIVEISVQKTIEKVQADARQAEKNEAGGGKVQESSARSAESGSAGSLVSVSDTAEQNTNNDGNGEQKEVSLRLDNQEEEVSDECQGGADSISEIERRVKVALKQIRANKPEAKATDITDQEVFEEVRRAEDYQQFADRLADVVQIYEKTLHLIYTRYNANQDKKQFVNQVERMTLVNLMLLWQKDLGLGEVQSNLFRLLLDLVLKTDGEEPDGMKFLREHSLTEYFDDAQLRDGGFVELVRTLDIQAQKALENVVSFVSELRGMKYLMDTLEGDPEAEVIIVNADADEFLRWLHEDNLVAANEHAKGLFRIGALSGDFSGEAIYPALVYMTDSAFGNNWNNKLNWIRRLQNFKLKQDAFAMLLPPICLSTGPQGEIRDRGLWEAQGRELAKEASETPAPMLILGPSPRLNPESDGFPTYLPAGYLLCAHLLTGGQSQGLMTANQGIESSGRFATLFTNAETVQISLNSLVWGTGNNNGYFFTGDFHLYVVLNLWLTMLRNRKRTVDPIEFWQTFCYPKDDERANNHQFLKCHDLDDVALRGAFSRLALKEFVPEKGNELVSMYVGATDHSIGSDWNVRTVGSASEPFWQWFNKARKVIERN